MTTRIAACLSSVKGPPALGLIAELRTSWHDIARSKARMVSDFSHFPIVTLGTI